MRMIVFLAVAIICAVYTGFFNMDLLVWGVPLPIVATTVATAAIAYVLAFARA